MLTSMKALEEGMVGLAIGGERQITIPPELAYGVKGHANIPSNATLTYRKLFHICW